MEEKDKKIKEFEQIIGKIIDKNDAIYIMFLLTGIKNEKHYYYICEKDKEFYIKHVTLDSDFDIDKINIVDFRRKYLREIDLHGRNKRLKFLLDYSFNYDDKKNGIIECSDNDNPKFYCYIPGKNKFYSFDYICSNIFTNGFYDFVNYLLIQSNIENKYYKRVIMQNSVLDEALLFDDELLKYFIKTKSIKKLNLNENYTNKCKDLCSMMNNYSLFVCICFTDFVCVIGNAFDKIIPEIMDWDNIRTNSKVRVNSFFTLVQNEEYVLSLNIDKEEIDKILIKLDVDHQIDMILKCMTNEEIMKISSQTNNWNVKLDLMKYIKTE